MVMLTAGEVPSLLKRSHINHGYRPLNQPNFYYYKSAFTLHNELVNVWTHFIPVVFLLAWYIIPELTAETPRFPLLILYFGVIALWMGSTLAHLLHSRSPIDHIFWFNIDFAGIAVFALCIGLQRYAAETENGPIIDWLYLPSLVLVVLGMQYLSTSVLFVTRPHWPYRHLIRLVTCLLLAVWLYVPLMERYLNPHPEPSVSLHIHSKAFFWLLFSGIFMGGNVPERWAPGKFDLLGYGHQLFHICINMVAWNLCDAAYIDCNEATASPFLWRNTATTATLGASFVIIWYTIKKLMAIAREKKYE